MPGPQIKRWDVYHALRRHGMTKTRAARIANSAPRRTRKRHQRTGRRGRAKR